MSGSVIAENRSAPDGLGFVPAHPRLGRDGVVTASIQQRTQLGLLQHTRRTRFSTLGRLEQKRGPLMFHWPPGILPVDCGITSVPGCYSAPPSVPVSKTRGGASRTPTSAGPGGTQAVAGTT